MASAVYIFNDDYVRLTTQEFSHASHLQKGGSLFGQWTSTGNPVVHFAMPYSASEFDRNKMGRDLYDAFKICYIGEWRPVRSDSREIISRREITKHEDAPARFLVLNVSKAAIVPFLFDHHTPKRIENLERLPGENPFNKRDVFRPTQSTTNYNNPQRYGQQSGAVVHRQAGPSQAPQYQEAITTKPQWYASDKGSEKLQKVLDDFKKIARWGHVEMSRDSRSQDISMSFTDIYHQREWEVKFPPSFPSVDGAVLIEKPGPRNSSLTEYRQGPSEKASTAVAKMVATIKSRTALY